MPANEGELGGAVHEGDRPHGLPFCGHRPAGSIGVGTRAAQAEPLGAAVAPERRHRGQHGFGGKQPELGQGTPTDLELDTPDRHSLPVSLSPHGLPPVRSLGFHLGRLVVDPGTDALSAARTERKPGADPVGLMSGADRSPADEAGAVLGTEGDALDVTEEVDTGHTEAQGVDQRPQ